MVFAGRKQEGVQPTFITQYNNVVQRSQYFVVDIK
jgi:hypothetical protein